MQPDIKQWLPVKEKPLLIKALILPLLRVKMAEVYFVGLTQANPYHCRLYEGDVSPNSSTEPPIILILSWENHTVVR